MPSFFHPPLDLTTLKNLEIVRQLMSEHPAYFLESPYEGQVERMIKDWFDPKAVKARQASSDFATEDAENTFSIQDNKWEYLYHEVSTLYASLKAQKFTAEDEDKMAYFRTATSLMEKLVGLQERSLGLKQISEHNALIMRIMESVLSPTQRNEFIEQLKASFGNS